VRRLLTQATERQAAGLGDTTDRIHLAELDLASDDLVPALQRQGWAVVRAEKS
jgi:hypothetical protein